MTSEKKFKHAPDNVEAAENYHPYGYNPIEFRDLFTERYQACRKLGYSVFSTVWLAKDHERAPDLIFIMPLYSPRFASTQDLCRPKSRYGLPW